MITAPNMPGRLPRTRLGSLPSGFLLLDFPNDHECDEAMINECRMIRGLLTTEGVGWQTRIESVSSLADFEQKKWSPIDSPGVVHLSGHGTKNGLGFIGGHADWSAIANTLRVVVPRLKKRQQRILCISCCFSEQALDAMESKLAGYYTAAYHFSEKQIDFNTAITAWTMFYSRTIYRPDEEIIELINKLFEEEVISSREIDRPA